MSLTVEEVRKAMAWRARELSYYQRIVEASRSADGLTDKERDSLRTFATEEISQLNLASDDEVVKLYNFHMAMVTAVVKVACSTEDELID